MILFELFTGFLKVGMFAFGGAYAAIPLIREVVLSYGWISEEMLTYMIAVSESTPGPIMVNLATYIGSTQAGLPGSLIATFAVVLPSFLLILLITALLKKVLKNPWIQAALKGMKPCMAGIILAAGLHMIFVNCAGSLNDLKIDSATITLTVILGIIYFNSEKIFHKKMPPIMLIMLSAFAGIAVWGFLPV